MVRLAPFLLLPTCAWLHLTRLRYDYDYVTFIRCSLSNLTLLYVLLAKGFKARSNKRCKPRTSVRSLLSLGKRPPFVGSNRNVWDWNREIPYSWRHFPKNWLVVVRFQFWARVFQRGGSRFFRLTAFFLKPDNYFIVYAHTQQSVLWANEHLRS